MCERERIVFALNYNSTLARKVGLRMENRKFLTLNSRRPQTSSQMPSFMSSRRIRRRRTRLGCLSTWLETIKCDSSEDDEKEVKEKEEEERKKASRKNKRLNEKRIKFIANGGQAFVMVVVHTIFPFQHTPNLVSLLGSLATYSSVSG